MIIENSKSKIEVYDNYVVKSLKNQKLDNRWFDAYRQLSQENDFLVKIDKQNSRSEFTMERLDIITDLDKILKDEDFYYLLDKEMICKIIEVFNNAFLIGVNYSKNLDNGFFYHTDLHLYNFVLTKNREVKVLDPDSFQFQENFDHAYRYFQSQIFLMSALQKYYYVQTR